MSNPIITAKEAKERASEAASKRLAAANDIAREWLSEEVGPKIEDAVALGHTLVVIYPSVNVAADVITAAATLLGAVGYEASFYAGEPLNIGSLNVGTLGQRMLTIDWGGEARKRGGPC